MAAFARDFLQTYLLTFCPPGPDDRLKLTSPMLRGMVSVSRFASHFLAASSSASSASPPLFVAKLRIMPWNGLRISSVKLLPGVTWRSMICWSSEQFEGLRLKRTGCT